MRKQLIWLPALVLALGSAGAASAVPNIQTIRGSFAPKQLSKNRPAPISLFTDVLATNPGNPYQLPNPTTLAKVDYDKNGRFFQRGLPTCDPSQFTVATTTRQAKNACSDSLIGGGSSKVAVPMGAAAPPLYVEAVVTAFNGANRTVVLFTENDLSGAITLVGKIGKADPGPPPTGAGPGYGITLTVPVPPLGGGTATVLEFSTKVKKIYRYKGKKRSLVSARCPASKRLKAQARFTDDQGQMAVGTSSQRCKPKKAHKHHH